MTELSCFRVTSGKILCETLVHTTVSHFGASILYKMLCEDSLLMHFFFLSVWVKCQATIIKKEVGLCKRHQQSVGPISGYCHGWEIKSKAAAQGGWLTLMMLIQRL